MGSKRWRWDGDVGVKIGWRRRVVEKVRSGSLSHLCLRDLTHGDLTSQA